LNDAPWHPAHDIGSNPSASSSTDDHREQQGGFNLKRRDEKRRAHYNPDGIAHIERARNQLVLRMTTQLEYGGYLGIVPDTERIEEACNAADDKITGRGSPWPSVPSRLP
jgi:hypothetical protein